MYTDYVINIMGGDINTKESTHTMAVFRKYNRSPESELGATGENTLVFARFNKYQFFYHMANN